MLQLTLDRHTCNKHKKYEDLFAKELEGNCSRCQDIFGARFTLKSHTNEIQTDRQRAVSFFVSNAYMDS